MTTKSARRLLTDLHEMYGQSNAPLLYQLKKEIKNISQTTDESIVEYYNKLKRHWDDSEDLEPYPDFTYGVMSKCTCNLLKKVLEMASREKVITFLMGLDDSYDNLRTNILSMEPLPTINKAYSLVQQIESEKSFSKLVHNQAESSVMAVNRGKGQGNWNKPGDAKHWNVWTRDGAGAGTGTGTGKDGVGQPKKGKRWCDYCNKSGHTRDTCFILHLEQREKYNARFANQTGGSAHNVSKEDNLLMGDDDHSGFTITGTADSSKVDIDPKLFAAIYQQMMHFKQQGGHVQSDYSAINFAGNSLVTNAYTTIFKSPTSSWINDSGVTDHMSSAIHLFVNKKLLPKPIKVGLPDGTCKFVTLTGDVVINQHLVLYDVFYVADFKHNLLSVGKLLAANGYSVNFNIDGCVVQDHPHKVTVGVGIKEGGLYKLESHKDDKTWEHSSSQVSISSTSQNKVCTSDLALLHARLGHSSLSKMRHLDFVKSEGMDKFVCETCALAKMHKLPYKRSDSLAYSSFDLVHIDLWGPYKRPSLTGATYFLTIMDDHTRVTWTFLLKDKYKVFQTIKDYLAQIKTQFHKDVKIVRSDNGTEIVQQTCGRLFLDKGILHQKSAPGCPQQNGRVERKHKHLIETARALILFANLPKKFWGECLLAATHIINKLSSSVLSWQVPSELLFNKPVTYDELRIIGCLCFALSPGHSRDKFDPKARKCIMISYPFLQKAYKLYDLESHKIIISRDVFFHESTLPYKAGTPAATSFPREPLHVMDLHCAEEDSNPIVTNTILSPTNNTTHTPNTTCDITPDIPTNNSTHIHTTIPSNTSTTSPILNDNISTTSTNHINEVVSHASRTSARNVNVPARLQDCVCPILPRKTGPNPENFSTESSSFTAHKVLLSAS
ncbi:uncharacterized protein LOC141607195 [Silene latifolia]|uniref:uncharacterized protein LOC141607195 n=1 Tax=Silene latifolia TaxID=37657 RepID=UPI003D786B0D